MDLKALARELQKARRSASRWPTSAITICSSRCSIRSPQHHLATSEIAWPNRYLLRGRPEVTTLFATVSGVDTQEKRVLLEDGDAVPYGADQRRGSRFSAAVSLPQHSELVEAGD
jgi:hypothetical protein